MIGLLRVGQCMIGLYDYFNCCMKAINCYILIYLEIDYFTTYVDLTRNMIVFIFPFILFSATRLALSYRGGGIIEVMSLQFSCF